MRKLTLDLDTLAVETFAVGAGAGGGGGTVKAQSDEASHQCAGYSLVNPCTGHGTPCDWCTAQDKYSCADFNTL